MKQPTTRYAPPRRHTPHHVLTAQERAAKRQAERLQMKADRRTISIAMWFVAAGFLAACGHVWQTWGWRNGLFVQTNSNEQFLFMLPLALSLIVAAVIWGRRTRQRHATHTR